MTCQSMNDWAEIDAVAHQAGRVYSIFPEFRFPGMRTKFGESLWLVQSNYFGLYGFV
jgi:hypothetical protein